VFRHIITGMIAHVWSQITMEAASPSLKSMISINEFHHSWGQHSIVGFIAEFHAPVSKLLARSSESMVLIQWMIGLSFLALTKIGK
jgi:hypothetical protein